MFTRKARKSNYSLQFPLKLMGAEGLYRKVSSNRLYSNSRAAPSMISSSVLFSGQTSITLVHARHYPRQLDDYTETEVTDVSSKSPFFISLKLLRSLFLWPMSLTPTSFRSRSSSLTSWPRVRKPHFTNISVYRPILMLSNHSLTDVFSLHCKLGPLQKSSNTKS